MSDVMQGKLQIVAIILFVLLLKWCITYHSHSGQGKPPIFGDYEAQRHWQEITLHLPIQEWYRNSTDNDLLYWGLDYPPLTSYHSYIVGQFAQMINPLYVKLHDSRGFCNSSHKYFMRLSVLCADILIYIPALVYFFCNLHIQKNYQNKNCNMYGLRQCDVILLTALTYPGLNLIDYGHFQYNCVSLGLFIGAVAAIYKDAFIIGTVLFVSALNYKQMELYHSLPFFCYILSIHMPGKNGQWLRCLRSLLCISLTVVLTFLLIWAPFILNGTFSDVIVRLFPLSRGLFEDKVANIWCTINVFYKFRGVFNNIQLAKICLVTTVLVVLPACTDLFLKPSIQKFSISLINVALGFFLFSFQVHEKSILLVAIPVLLHFHNDPLPCFWFLIMSHFSMLPLFIKDDLRLAYVTTGIFYIIIVFWLWLDTSSYNSMINEERIYKMNKLIRNYKNYKSVQQYELQQRKIESSRNVSMSYQSFWILLVFFVSILGMVLLSITSLFLQPPKRYPDLFPLLVSIYSCGHFLIFFMYFNYKQYYVPTKNIDNKLKIH